MANQISGSIEHIAPTNERKSSDGTKTYYRRELIINARRFDPYTGEPTADNFISLDIVGQDRCNELDQFKRGDFINAHFFLDGRKYTKQDTGETKYFTSVNCYKIERIKLRSEKNPEPEPQQDLPF